MNVGSIPPQAPVASSWGTGFSPAGASGGRLFNRSQTVGQLVAAPAGLGLREIGNICHDPSHPTKPYRLYFSAFPPPYSETGEVRSWVATSPDLVHWTTEPGPMITTRSLEDPYIIRSPFGGWELYAEDKTAQPQRYMRVFRSPDGLTNWTDLGNVGVPVGGSGAWNALDVSSPVVWNEGRRRYLLTEGRGNGQSGAIGLFYTDNTDPTQPWTALNGGQPVAIGNNPGFFGAVATGGRTPAVPWSQLLVPDDLIKLGPMYLLLAHGYTMSNRFVPVLLTSTDLLTWVDATGHELFNPDSVNAPAETWMFGDPAGGTVYFTDSNQTSGGSGIKLASTRFEAPRKVNLLWNAALTSQRLYLPPGPQALLSFKVDGTGVFDKVRIKDFGDGDGGAIQIGAPTFDANPFPMYLDVPASGPGRILDIRATPSSPGGQIYAQLTLL